LPYPIGKCFWHISRRFLRIQKEMKIASVDDFDAVIRTTIKFVSS
jgi:hypothetical protein